jgi:hypothetical protein
VWVETPDELAAQIKRGSEMDKPLVSTRSSMELFRRLAGEKEKIEERIARERGSVARAT